MSKQEMMRLREMLLKRRKEIFERLRQFESDWQPLTERDIELEEEAQKADLTRLFDELDEREQHELEEIDLALCRMAVGSYAICENCKNQISLKRLQFLPAARLCRKCARKYEEKQEKLPPAREVITRGQVPSEYRNLSNEELATLILERFRNDGRVDLEELQISCRKGVVYLEGVVPSESEHQILLQILTDVMGFTSIVDHLKINKLTWEQEERAPGRADFPLSVDVDEITEDVFESQEEGKPYMFPDRPPPEEK
ncbi:MAG: TraR/DksA C4-type zinc finger protein [Desulfobacterales bacterium]|nr:TraR/DksA C4-type zinc finger protein [Desulfobacterales bacterium]